MTYEAALAAYEKSEFSAGRWTRPVYRRGAGPAVIVIHEMPGLHPDVIRFADRVAEAGLTVFCPSLFGEPGRSVTPGYGAREILKGICIRREFDVWATDRSSPIVEWLRALARKAHAECGGRGVGAVGMCFTGGFALAMMTEPAVVAPVVSQPSLPLPILPGKAKRARSIDLSAAEIACARRRFAEEDLNAIGLRFEGDPVVPRERFDRYEAEFGDRFERWDIDPAEARPGGGLPHPHSVLTINLREDGETKRAEQRVIAFFKSRTAAV
ncbi:dienelactone hydrolase family protein [Phenylobacterium sp. J367]|uniref:dienelactone hydrolase family protein n=1 Tax=Phenylobacterium sp. J367 TaxID=2898435 RepID=UPI0021511E8B|nr:dienelactone hydrolase family protein [Phenylobacterium sp. J367]MCR5878026.1 dienelactone hydrolase family protein [Phenylobacterium sp. J367]